MNINKSALDKAYRLAHDSGKVEPGRLVKAMSLVVDTKLNATHIRLDKSRYSKYLVPGTDYPWYAIDVETGSGKPIIGGCSCKDHQRNRGRLCKHMLAVMLIIRAGEIENTDLPPMEVISRAVSDPTYRERALALLYPYSD